jgi:hypothetical protein
MVSFRKDQIALLAESGWATCGSVAEAVSDEGLPPITREYLESSFTDDEWSAAEAAVSALTDHFATARFAAETTYGVLLVPDPGRLDTRRPMHPEVRRDQLGEPVEDFFDERLPAGTLSVPPGRPWTMVATIVGHYGPSLGSYRQVLDEPSSGLTVAGVDTRRLMTRQIWGARVLQSGADLPDCNANQRWTFTVFPGEGLTDGCAESGTVLYRTVRFRLGKPDRGIGSARVAPAIMIR